jgi:molybdate transport repressor ModE-like protein
MGESKESFPSLKPNYKLWLEYNGEYVFGPGAYALLKCINEAGTITQGAKDAGMSYRYAWGVIRKIEKKLGTKLLDSYKGGTVGGGGARVTEFGISLMKLFTKVNETFARVIESSE